MNPAILALVVTTLFQAFAAVWWASRISAQLESLQKTVDSARIDISALHAAVQAHEVELAVLRSKATK